MPRLLARAVGAVILAAVTAALLAGPASADVYVDQDFKGATAPGWTFLGSAKLTAASGGTDAAGSGWLQLTTNGGSQAGSAIYNTAFPSDQGVVAEFDAVAYGGTGADGISFFLLDGSVASPTIGATGQGLGYTNDCTHDGVSKGYVAVGIDEYGNFSEGTSFCKNGPGRKPNSFAIRGPGDGRNASASGTQYGYLAGTNPPAGTIQGTSRADLRRYSLYISPDHKVSLSWRPTVGGSWQPLLTDVAIPGTVPATFKLGFSASTGGSTNYHEVRNLVVGPPVNLAVATTSGGTYARRGSTVSYDVTASNSGPNPATGASIADTVPSALTGVTWTCTGAGGGSCATASGSGNAISTSADLPVGGSVVLHITGTVDSAASGSFSNAASVTPPSTVIDTDATDNAQSTSTTVNDAPVVTSGGTLAYTENDAATTVDAGVTATDPDANISAGSVRISSGYVSGEDVLSYAKPAGSPLNGSFDATTGVLSLTGTGTPAQWQAALRAVRYRNTSDAPSTATRTLTFSLTDTPGLTGTDTRDIAVTAVDDAPTVTAGGTLAYTEDDPATAIAPSLTVADVDGGETGATVALTAGYASGEDELGYVAPAGSPVSGSFDAATGVLTLSGAGSAADYQAALRAVTYRNGSDAPSTASRTATFTVSGPGGSGAATRTITVAATPDAPEVHASASTLTVDEGSAPTAVDPGVTVADAEDALASATVAIAAGYDTGRDVLAYTAPAGNPVTGAWDAATGTLSLTGPATAAELQDALRAVTIRSTGSATTDRTVRFTVTDDSALSAHDDRAATVAPRPPVNDTAPALTGVLRVGGTVTGARGDWSGTDPIGYAWQWERCDGASCAAIAGATGTTYTLTPEDAGRALRLAIVADNAAPGTVSAESAPSAVVAPALRAPDIASGPSASTTDTDAAFAVVGEPGAQLECSLDGGAWTACDPRQVRTDLTVGDHVLRVRQTLDGLTSPEATYRWTVAAPPAPSRSTAVGKVPSTNGAVRADGGAVGAACGTAGAAMRSCTVVATVTVGGRTIVVGRGRTGAARTGAERPVRIVLTAAGRRLLSRTGHLEATFAFAAVDATGQVLGVSRHARIDARLLVTVRRYFPVDDPTLDAGDKAFLAHLARRYPYATHIRCEGHADGTATDAHGLWLGRHRARNACGFLASHGLHASRRVISYGTRRPQASDRTAAGRARNRVVIVTLSA